MFPSRAITQDRGRVGGRGRGRGRGRGHGGPPQSKASWLPTDVGPQRDFNEGLSLTPIATLAKPLDPGGANVTTKNVKYIGSYNWVNADKPTIIVPGAPPIWADRPTPYKVAPDIGTRFRDQTSARMPGYPFLPLARCVDVKAMEHDHVPFDWSSVDFVTDRNGLRKLLRWINDTESEPDAEFRIDMQLAGNKTVLFNRLEKAMLQQMPGFTYGFHFEEEATNQAEGCEDSTGYHRVISYDLGGLNMVVRFEVDAMVSTKLTKITRLNSKSAGAATDVDDLVASLGSISISPQKSKDSEAPSFTPSNELTVQKGGTYDVPQQSLLEITSRSIKRRDEPINWMNEYPQLFFAATPYHYTGIHERGNFKEYQKRHTDDIEFKQVYLDAQPALRKLVQILKEIQEIVVNAGQRVRLSLLYKDGVVRVFEREGMADCLPQAEMEAFDN